MNNYIQQIVTYFRNMVLNSSGVERDLLQLIQDNDISTAVGLMQNRDIEVDKAIREYNPETHEVMKRPNKYRKGEPPYITEKLPRTRQKYINEVELFFLLGSNIKWKKRDGDEEAFALFKDFLKQQHFYTNMRKAKRLAGAETESAKMYHIYRDERTNDMRVKTVILARSEGYQLRPLFDQYKNMTAFAYGYKLKENGKTVQHWDIQTADFLFFCKKGNVGWNVETYPNPTGKINILYYHQEKAWSGVEKRISREEDTDSRIGDTNNYFSDPIAAASADVINSMTDPNKPGKLIQLGGANSRFEYVNPPQSSELQQAEKRDLNDSILFDTFTPDFSFEKIKGIGTLSGEAIKKAMMLGYIKRDNRIEIYGELMERDVSIIIGILKSLHPDKAKALDSLDIEFEFGEPFNEDKQSTWSAIGKLYNDGICSLEQAVTMLALTDAPEEEVNKIRSAKVDTESNKTGIVKENHS